MKEESTHLERTLDTLMKIAVQTSLNQEAPASIGGVIHCIATANNLFIFNHRNGGGENRTPVQRGPIMTALQAYSLFIVVGSSTGTNFNLSRILTGLSPCRDSLHGGELVFMTPPANHQHCPSFGVASLSR